MKLFSLCMWRYYIDVSVYDEFSWREVVFVGVKTTNRMQQLHDFNTVCYEKVIQQVRNGHQVGFLIMFLSVPAPGSGVYQLSSLFCKFLLSELVTAGKWTVSLCIISVCSVVHLLFWRWWYSCTQEMRLFVQQVFCVKWQRTVDRLWCLLLTSQPDQQKLSSRFSAKLVMFKKNKLVSKRTSTPSVVAVAVVCSRYFSEL